MLRFGLEMRFIKASWVSPTWWDVLMALEVGHRDYQDKRAKRPAGSTQTGVTDMRPSSMRGHIKELKLKNKERPIK